MRTEEIVNLFLPKGTDDLANVIGPQGNLIDKLEAFNTKYILPSDINPLKVTKKWRWAPGTYDRVKTAYTRKVLQWHRRPRHMYSLFERKRTWFENDMKRELNDIEQYLIGARRDNAIWLDENTDTGILQQVTAEFAYKIEKLYEIVESEYDSFDVHVAQEREVWPHQSYQNRGDGLAPYDGKYIITINMPEKPIEVTMNNAVIGTVPFPALSVHIMIDVPRWISHSMSPQNINTRSYHNNYQHYFNLAVYYEVPHKWFSGDEGDVELLSGKHWPIFHPFIQAHGYRDGEFRDWNWRNICWGDYGNDIINSFMMMDWDAFFLFIDKWLYQYEMNGANPLNNIRTSFLGIGPDTSNVMLDIVGYRGIDCANRLSGIFSINKADYRAPQYDIGAVLNYCDMVRDCQLRFEGKDQCVGYKRNVKIFDHAEIVNEMIGDPIEKPLSIKKTIYIHEQMRKHFTMESDYPYYGTEHVYKRLSTEIHVTYHKVFEGAYFQMTYIDQVVVAYAILNEYWDAYIEITAFSYLMKNGYNLEDDTWDEAMEKASKRVALAFNKLMKKATEVKIAKSAAETEADKTRAEMLEWANQVSSGRIVNNPFNDTLDEALEDIENSEPSI